jgi:DNA-binding transcriptional MocR family regulator
MAKRGRDRGRGSGIWLQGIEGCMEGQTFWKIPVDVGRSKKMNWNIKAVYMYVLSFSTARKPCWASNKTIADTLILSESTVTRAINTLQKEGLLSIAYKTENLNTSRILHAKMSSQIDEGSSQIDYQEDKLLDKSLDKFIIARQNDFSKNQETQTDFSRPDFSTSENQQDDQSNFDQSNFLRPDNSRPDFIQDRYSRTELKHPENPDHETDLTTRFNAVREKWTEQNLKPECRDIFISPVNTEKVSQTFQHYSQAEIFNAIENYAWHLNLKLPKAQQYESPFRYPTIYGFLKTGVSKYYDDDAIDAQFLRGGK